MILINSNRIRSIIADCKTEQEIILSLRSHKIKYTYTTETGFLSIRIPCKKGIIRIYKTCSRSAPFVVRSETASFYPFPLPVYSWND